jgi:hypothetical protein
MKKLAMLNVIHWRWENLQINGEHFPHRRFGAMAFGVNDGFVLLGGMKLEKYQSSDIYVLDVNSKRVREQIRKMEDANAKERKGLMNAHAKSELLLPPPALHNFMKNLTFKINH